MTKARNANAFRASLFYMQIQKTPFRELFYIALISTREYF